MRVAHMLSIIMLFSVATAAHAQRYLLKSGESIGVGEQLMMTSKIYKDYFVLEKDGTLQHFQPNSTPGRPPQKIGRGLGTPGAAANYIVTMKNDGNLVILAPNGAVAWDAGVKGMPVGNYFALLFTNGSILVYAGTDPSNQSGNPVWNSLGISPVPYNPYRLPLTDVQAKALSAAQVARYSEGIVFKTEAERKKFFDEREAAAEAFMKKLRTDLAAKQAADAVLAAKQAALTAGKVVANCPKQLEGDKVQGRGDMLYEDGARTTMRTRNCLNRPVWITIYDVTKLRHLDFGCVEPFTLRDWKGGNYLAGVYYVRAEIVENHRTQYGRDECMGAKLDGGDTTIQADVGPTYLGAALDVDIMIDPKKGNFYFDGPTKVGTGTLKGIGNAVSYASERLKVTAAVTYVWKQLQASCGTVAKYMPTPLTPYLVAAEKLGTKEVKAGTACYSAATEAFYCEFPAELARIFDSAASASALGERVAKESVSSECIGFTAAAAIMPQAPLFCAMGKVLIGDAAKMVTCATAAESAGIVKKALLGAGQTYVDFPSDRACRSVGRIGYEVAINIATDGISDQAKAAMKAGKGRTASMVASEIMSINDMAGKASTLENLTKDLEALPACKG